MGESGNAQAGHSYDTIRLERYAEVAFEVGIRQIHLHGVGRRTAGIDHDGRHATATRNFKLED